MGDRFFHPDGQKAQDITMRGGKLIRKTGDNPSPSGNESTDENIRRRNQLLGEAASNDAGKVEQTGVSGYMKNKKKVTRALDEAGNTDKPEEES